LLENASRGRTIVLHLFHGFCIYFPEMLILWKISHRRDYMINLETDLEGKQMSFGFARKKLKEYGFHIGGNWDYDRGMFDGILNRENGETIYLRLPFHVLEGELDRS